METTEIGRIVCINGTPLFKSPCQLLFVRTLQKCQLAARGDIQSAMTQRIQQGMGVSIFIKVKLYRAQAWVDRLRSRLLRTARSSSR